MTSKYDRLADHLVAIGAPVIILTFTAVEAIVGPLPAMARRARAWWDATPAGPLPSSLRDEQVAGRIHRRPPRTAHPALARAERTHPPAAETVTFRRVGP